MNELRSYLVRRQYTPFFKFKNHPSTIVNLPSVWFVSWTKRQIQSYDWSDRLSIKLKGQLLSCGKRWWKLHCMPSILCVILGCLNTMEVNRRNTGMWKTQLPKRDSSCYIGFVYYWMQRNRDEGNQACLVLETCWNNRYNKWWDISCLKISWNNMGWWLRQKQKSSVNSLDATVGLYLLVYTLSLKINSPIKKINDILTSRT